MLEIYQPFQAIPANEAASCSLPMFPDATDQIVGDANVKRSIVLVRHDVDPSADPTIIDMTSE
jgi:hypothetical protein